MTWTRTATTRTPTPTTLTVSEERRAEGGVSPDRRYAALAHCIAPFAANEFLEHHWERKPLLVERAAPGRFDDLLSEDDVEHAVCTSGLRYPAFRLVKAGAQLKPAEYTRDIPWRPSAFTAAADVRRVIAEFEQGATIVLQALHLHRYPLAAFCRRLEAELGHPAQANAYYTPRRSQGLPVHHDTHDVFVLQVAGHKRWLVYEPALELPLKNQRYSRALGELGEPVLDVTIAAGDTLYLPRGWLHQALTSETDSLHLTIGVNVYTWLDAYRAALDSCADDVEFRRSVPGDGRPDTDLCERFRARMTPDAIARADARAVRGDTPADPRRPAQPDPGTRWADARYRRAPARIGHLRPRGHVLGAATRVRGHDASLPSRDTRRARVHRDVEGSVPRPRAPGPARRARPLGSRPASDPRGLPHDRAAGRTRRPVTRKRRGRWRLDALHVR